jgi:hypothetical protein
LNLPSSRPATSFNNDGKDGGGCMIVKMTGNIEYMKIVMGLAMREAG